MVYSYSGDFVVPGGYAFFYLLTHTLEIVITLAILPTRKSYNNVIAHSNELSEDEIIRLKLLIKDWFRIQG